MPQSLSAVYIHLVFSTKERRPFLRDPVTREALHAYLGGISKTLDCPPILIGGMEDHVHVLARFGRTITQAEWVKELKRVSNLWLKEEGVAYGDFQMARRLCGLFGEPIQVGPGKELYCGPGNASPEDGLSGRASLIASETRCRMGRTICVGLSRHPDGVAPHSPGLPYSATLGWVQLVAYY